MDEQPRPERTSSCVSGSAWAAFDETFFRIVADVFPHSFCAGASALLASNDADAPQSTLEIPDARLPHETALEIINQEIERELALRRAMRRHPSGRRW